MRLPIFHILKIAVSVQTHQVQVEKSPQGQQLAFDHVLDERAEHLVFVGLDIFQFVVDAGDGFVGVVPHAFDKGHGLRIVVLPAHES